VTDRSWPDVGTRPQSTRAKHRRRAGSFHSPQGLSLGQTPLVPGRNRAVLIVRWFYVRPGRDPPVRQTEFR